LKWGWGHQQKIVFEFLCEAAEEAQGGVVLDAGAGHQRYKPFFHRSLYLAQEHPIAGLKNKGIKNYDILSDIKKIPLADNCVDLILSTSSLEHVEFPDMFFAESVRVLKPGGSLYINVPFAYEEHEIPYDFQRPTRYGLLRYYSCAGFEKTTVSPTSSSVYAAQYLFLNAIRNESLRAGIGIKAAAIKKIIKYSAEISCKLAMRFLDNPPREETTLPIGWVAKGYKHGLKSKGVTCPSKKDFLSKNMTCDNEFLLKEGKIISSLSI
jgi:SAM-dependent methyltransferase